MLDTMLRSQFAASYMFRIGSLVVVLAAYAAAQPGESRAPSDVVRWPREGISYHTRHYGSIAVDGDRLAIAFPFVSLSSTSPPGQPVSASVVQVWALDGSGHWNWSQVLLSPAIHGSQGLNDNLDMGGGLLAVGAPALPVASAFIYRRQGNGYVLEHAEARPGSGDAFGHSVAILSPSKIAVGAPMAVPAHGAGEGRVHIFELHGASWVETQVLVPIMTLWDFEGFGFRMKAGGGHLVVGAPNATIPNTHTNIGKTYVYRDTPGGLVLDAMLQGPPSGNPWDSNFFGVSFAINERWLAVGRSYRGTFSSRPGEVMFYFNDAAQGWIWHSTVLAPQPLVGDAFGKSVEWAGERLIVSAHAGRCDGETSAAHVLELGGSGTWRAVECLAPANDPGAPDSITFGDGMAAQGDLVFVSDSWNAQWGTNELSFVPHGCTFAFELTPHDQVCTGATPVPGGSVARLDLVGDRSATSTSLRAILSNAPEPMVTVFLAARTFGASAPLGGGTVCLQPPWFQFGQALTDEVGHAVSAPLAPALPLAPGDTWTLQAWHRLPGGPSTATSTAIRVSIE